MPPMPPISTERFCTEIAVHTAALARMVEGTDLTRQIPTCPDWTLRQLATHVGRAHRWAAEITATRSATFIDFRAVPDGKFPADQAEGATWLNAGAQVLIGAVLEAGSEEVWTLGGMAPAAFWARRMAHETVVHRADAELAAGREVSIAADLAADGIDEWLVFLSGPLGGGPDRRTQALPEGRVLHVHAADDELDGSAEWLVRHTPSGVVVETGHGGADVALAGHAARLLLVLMRRLPPSDPAITVSGDASLLAQWLAGTAF